MDSDLDLYRRALHVIEKNALMRLEQWWYSGNRWKLSPEYAFDTMREPFTALVQVFGAQAAAAAVDQLILGRSLDDELRFNPTPPMSEVAAAGQIESSLQWALNTSRSSSGGIEDQMAWMKLQGVLNRLVLFPARQTVLEACERDGTGYARIPEPGACPFCLMLASRGAVYSKDTVVSTKKMAQYHDHCRCLGIEAPLASPKNRFQGLPPVNEELRKMWETNVGADSKPYWSSEKRHQQWRNLIIHKRREKTNSDSPVRWPPLPGIVMPTYTVSANYSVFGKVEPLPALDKMPGHVLFGWTDKDDLPARGEQPVDHGREAHTRGDRQGHRWGSKRPGATVFPESWSDQQIVDAVRDTIENPDEYSPLKGPTVSRRVRKNIDGVLIEAEWTLREGQSEFSQAMPIRGEGVRLVAKDGRYVEPKSRRSGDKRFKPVEGG